MKTTESYVMGTNELTNIMNEGIDYFLGSLLTNGTITREQYDEYVHYRIVVGKRSMWGRFWSRLTGDTSNTKDLIFVVKPISIPLTETENAYV
jgi:hypothetical protein